MVTRPIGKRVEKLELMGSEKGKRDRMRTEVLTR